MRTLVTNLKRCRPAGLLALALSALSAGCAALTNPVGDAIPVNRLPPEVLGGPRDGDAVIDLTLLRQPAPEVYRVGPGDVLEVFIENILGRDPPPRPPGADPLVDAAGPVTGRGSDVQVQEDGTVNLPLVPPVSVQGLTPLEVQETLRRLYTVKRQLLPARAFLRVALKKPRRYRVVVMRPDAGPEHKGGYVLELPAYENDLLTALARSGGLPGLESAAEVIVQRRKPVSGHPGGAPAYVTRVPLRGGPAAFAPEDVILGDGDVVFIRPRDREHFYTGGLLPAGEHKLPGDRDLDVLEALMLAGGPLVNGGLNPNNATRTYLVPHGVGRPSPSLLVVVRKLCNGGQVAIRVDLRKALRDRRERILVQPGDVLILQEKPCEAMVRYCTTFWRLEW